jgi:hypothetical protein
LNVTDYGLILQGVRSYTLVGSTLMLAWFVLSISGMLFVFGGILYVYGQAGLMNFESCHRIASGCMAGFIYGVVGLLSTLTQSFIVETVGPVYGILVRGMAAGILCMIAGAIIEHMKLSPFHRLKIIGCWLFAIGVFIAIAQAIVVLIAQISIMVT